MALRMSPVCGAVGSSAEVISVDLVCCFSLLFLFCFVCNLFPLNETVEVKSHFRQT